MVENDSRKFVRRMSKSACDERFLQRHRKGARWGGIWLSKAFKGKGTDRAESNHKDATGKKETRGMRGRKSSGGGGGDGPI